MEHILFMLCKRSKCNVVVVNCGVLGVNGNPRMDHGTILYRAEGP